MPYFVIYVLILFVIIYINIVCYIYHEIQGKEYLIRLKNLPSLASIIDQASKTFVLFPSPHSRMLLRKWELSGAVWEVRTCVCGWGAVLLW